MVHKLISHNINAWAKPRLYFFFFRLKLRNMIFPMKKRHPDITSLESHQKLFHIFINYSVVIEW